MRLDSLKTKAEFDFIYKNAKKFFHKYFVLYVLRISHYQSHQVALHIGFSISRKIGKANKRNLLRRRVKAIMYENRIKYEGLVCVFVAKEGVTCIDFATLKKDLLFALDKTQEIINS